MAKRVLYLILILFLLVDCGFSFMQHYAKPLDGDMAGGIVPENAVKHVLSSPLGGDALIKKEYYANPNRFFSHYAFKAYFNAVPFYFQKITDPIHSIYLSCALAKILIQISLIILLSVAIAGTWNAFTLDFLIAASLITPLFQTNGYQGSMGIIDVSTTYTFFYAFPVLFILLYFVPIFIKKYHLGITLGGKRGVLFLLPLAVVCCLSGPLNPGVVLIISLIYLIASLLGRRKFSIGRSDDSKQTKSKRFIPNEFLIYFLPICLLAVYSLYLGCFNSINNENYLPLIQVYAKLPMGVFTLFTHKIGFLVLFIMLILNTFLIKTYYSAGKGVEILKFIRWTWIFVLLYILLLPLGGYRPYRPFILRYDTCIPVSMSFIFAFGLSCFYILKNITHVHRRWYLPLLLLVVFIYTNADKAKFESNKNEILVLEQIAASKEVPVRIPADCLLLSWRKIEDPKDSDLNAELLMLWNVTKEKKHYYNQ